MDGIWSEFAEEGLNEMLVQEEQDTRFKLLLKRLANVDKVCKKYPKMSMFDQSKIIKKLNKNLYYKGGK